MANDKKHRPKDNGENARRVTAAETAAIDVTAATMLLGLLAGRAQAEQQAMAEVAAREAAQHELDLQRQPGRPHHDNAAAAGDAAAPAQPDVLRAGAAGEAAHGPPANAGSLTGAHADHAGPETGAPAPDSTSGSDSGSGTAAQIQPDLHAPHSGAGEAASDAPAVLSLSGITASLQSGIDSLAAGVNAIIDSLHDTVTGLTNSIAQLQADLHHTVASLADSVSDLGGLTQSITGTVTSLTDHALAAPAALADGIVSTAFSAAPPVPSANAADIDVPLIDHSDLVPVSVEHVPLHIDVIGQPALDHAQHDGAFTALGMNHF